MLLFYEELRELNAAPPSLLVPKNPPMHDATPEEIRALTTEAAATGDRGGGRGPAHDRQSRQP